MQKSEVIVGQLVTYFAVIKEDSTKLNPCTTRILSEVTELPSGEEVCQIEGKRGMVSIKHLEIVPLTEN